jgi:G3E family GTPase
MNNERIPVTVLTGFLGSGKTTLLNRILSENHGQRIAVIENEFGEIGVDQALVIDADEEIFEMNNGCICCTVRGDLIRILGNLMKRRDKFDRVIVETTGLANPGPVAQTFFVDEDVQGDFRLDGIVTLVDSRHVGLHLDESSEAREQIAFGDVIVLNKTDLVGAEELATLEARIRAINGMAQIRRAHMAEVPIPTVLDIGGFDLDRTLERQPTFLEPEFPFEWTGLYDLPAASELVLSPGPDPTMSVVIAPMMTATLDAVASLVEQMVPRFSTPPVDRLPGDAVAADGSLQRLCLTGTAPMSFSLTAPRPGLYALVSQHHPSEFRLHVEVAGRKVAPFLAREWAAGHTHDITVSSVGLVLDQPLDESKLNRWIAALLREQGGDIFRMKGILDIAGQDRRFVFQGVHMLFDGRPDRPWATMARRSQLVFIGRNLDRAALEAGSRACVA